MTRVRLPLLRSPFRTSAPSSSTASVSDPDLDFASYYERGAAQLQRNAWIAVAGSLERLGGVEAIDVGPGAAPQRGIAARRLTALAMASGLAAAVAIVVVASGDGGGDGDGGATWVLGLVFILAPLLFAGATHSLVGSHLLRPLGGIAVALCALTAAVHVGVAVDAAGVGGVAYAAPAIVTPLLLLAAVVKGPVTPWHGARAFEPAGALIPQASDTETIDGPPLDVSGAVRHARAHAAKSVVAWLVVCLVVAVAAIPVQRLLGWPEVVARLQGSVVSVTESGDTTAVAFEARLAGQTVTWQHVVDDSEWEVGERVDAVLDEDGNVHLDEHFGLAGLPLFMPAWLVGVFTLFAVRRLWGLAVAAWDLDRGQDRPRLGFVAVIDDPAPRTWRPLVAVWWEDPTTRERLAKPDAVYRADDETSEHLKSPATSVVVRRAWIDTGLLPRSKPRWIGVEDGVAVPHRRSVFGRWYIHVVTRRSRRDRVVGLHHGPPSGGMPSLSNGDAYEAHRFGGMVAWRLLGAVVGIGLSFLVLAEHPGHPATVEQVPG